MTFFVPELLNCFQTGLPAVITMTAYFPDVTTDGVTLPEACRRLEVAGAAVVGLNCGRGPRTMIPLMREIRKACKVSTDGCLSFYWPWNFY